MESYVLSWNSKVANAILAQGLSSRLLLGLSPEREPPAYSAKNHVGQFCKVFGSRAPCSDPKKCRKGVAKVSQRCRKGVAKASRSSS